jgi:hypothetical protein
MITAILIFFGSIIGILLFISFVFSVLRGRQRNRNSTHQFTSLGLTDSSSSSADSWDYSSSDSSDSSSSCSSGSDSGDSGSSCGGGCGGCGGGD